MAEASQAQTDKPADEVVPCRFCRKLIPKGARKCVECSSDLDWRRFLFFSNTTIAVFAALVSVCIASYPAIHRILTPENAPLQVHYAGLNAGSLTFSALVTNKGRNTGVLNQAIIFITKTGQPEPVLLIFPSPPKGKSIYVAGETSIGVDFDLRHVQAFQQTKNNPPVDITNDYRKRASDFLPLSDAECRLGFYYMDADGKTDSSGLTPGKKECGGFTALLNRAALDAEDHESGQSMSLKQ